MLLIKGWYSQRCRREQRIFATRCRYDAVQLISPTGHIIPCTEYTESNLYFTKERLLCWLIFSGLVYESSRGSNLGNKIWRWVTSALYYCPVMCHHFSFSSSPLPCPVTAQGVPSARSPHAPTERGVNRHLFTPSRAETPQLHHAPARSIPPHTNTNPQPGTRVGGVTLTPAVGHLTGEPPGLTQETASLLHLRTNEHYILSHLDPLMARGKNHHDI